MDMKTLKRSRLGHKSYTTKIVKETETLLAEKDIEDLQEIQEQLIAHQQILNDKIVVLKELDEKISLLIESDADLEKDIDESGDFHRYVLKTTISISSWLKRNSIDNASTISAVESTPSSTKSFSPGAKLPKLSLKRFNGDPLNFHSFWDCFESAIDKNSSLDDITKFNYLNSLLEGKACLALQGLVLSSENYRVAIKILKERFGDVQVVITAHMDALLNISPANSSSVHELRTIFDLIEVHTRNLETLDVDAKNYGPVLVSVVMNKLPQDFRLDITRKMPSGKWEIAELMKNFQQELIARERCASMEASFKIQNQESFKNQNNSENTFSTLHVQYDKKSINISCSFCKNNHPSNRCTIVTDVSARKQIIQSKNKCFNCLKSGHRAAQCRSKNLCYVCNNKHHISLCTRKNNNEGERNKSKNESETSVHVISCQDNVLLQTAQAIVVNPANENKTQRRVLFDNCSQKSFITSETRDKLCLPTLRNDVLTVKVFGGGSSEPSEKVVKLNVVKVKIENTNSNTFLNIEAHVVPIICSPISNQKVDLAKDRYSSIRALQLADDNSSDTKSVDILIGANYYWRFTTGRIIRTKDTLTAVHTILGWTLNGNIVSDNESNGTSVNVAHVLHSSCRAPETISNPETNLSKFWEIEDAGTSTDKSFDAKSFLDKITHDGERYTVPLPWKEEHDTVPDNYEGSKNRVQSLLHKLRKHPEVLKQYDAVIRQYENDGIIERVDNQSVPAGKVHYLPHHNVMKEAKSTTKLRIVYDASSNKPSLNDCLEKGPCLLPLLVDILIRFAAYKIAVSSDIQQAFLNVAVNETDRNFLRFLWFDDITSETVNIVTYRYTRVIFGMNSSQFLLTAAIMKHLQQYEEFDHDFVETFLKNLYVDDSTGGGDHAEEVLQFYEKSKSCLLGAGFNLRKWRSNDQAVQNAIRSQENDDLIEPDNKILGLSWNTESDTMSIDLQKIVDQGKSLPITKRNVLKTIASIYDPLGIISPLVILCKIFFQKLSVMKCDWDTELSNEIKNEWITLLELISSKSTYAWPRYYFGNSPVKELSNITLHGFCDASKKAYSAVVYITGQTLEGNTTGRIVASKTKVAPLKQLSIPKLELCSCLLLSSLFICVLQSLKGVTNISEKICWSDSLDALFWIKNENRNRNVFINNRTSKIRNDTPSELWRHCPGNLNPADLPSRGLLNNKKLEEKFNAWIKGPEFIYQPLDQWPIDLSEMSVKSDALSKHSVNSALFAVSELSEISENYIVSEPSESSVLSENSIVNEKSDINNADAVYLSQHKSEFGLRTMDSEPSVQTQWPESSLRTMDSEPLVQTQWPSDKSTRECAIFATHLKPIETYLKNIKEILSNGSMVSEIIDPKKYGNLNKLLRITAYVSRFIVNIKARIKKSTCKSGYLTVEELNNAEVLWIHSSQRSLSDNLKQLNNAYGIYLDDDHVVRCKGRLNNSSLTTNQKHPILLPAHDDISALLIRHAHMKSLHGGSKDTLIELRRKYWVLRGRSLVRLFIKKCTLCNKLGSKPFASKTAAQLPSYRVNASFPFQNTGVDYIGPVMVKPIFDTENQSMYNVHIVLYTCAVTRAVHLDVVPDPSASSFLRSLKRFIGRRGIPNLMISDNATCFRNEEVKLSEELLIMNITWKFIVEASPWWGGFWERLVKSVKNSLLKVLFRSSVTYEELETVLCEIEGVMNSRPITYLYSDEIEEVLTPSHLMYGRDILNENQQVNDDDEIYDQIKLSKRIKYLKLLKLHYWNRFKNEYLVNLREFHTQGKNTNQKIEAGEIVLVHANLKRIKWKMGKIISLMPSKDGNVRAAIVKVFTKGNNKCIYMKRPIEKLYPIEIKAVENVTEPELEQVDKVLENEVLDINDNTQDIPRPRRTAADNSILIRRLMNQV